MSGVKSGSRKVYERSMEERAYRQERAKERRVQQEEARRRKEEEKSKEPWSGRMKRFSAWIKKLPE